MFKKQFVLLLSLLFSVSLHAVQETHIFGIEAEANDAWQERGESINVNGPRLETGWINSIPFIRQEAEKVIGLRFPNVTIPPGKKIVDARIEFKGDGGSSFSHEVQIRIENTADPVDFNAQDIDSRGHNAISALNWTSDKWDDFALVTTPSLINLIRDVTSNSGWIDGNAMVFLFVGNNEILDWDKYMDAWTQNDDGYPRLVFTVDDLAAGEDLVHYRFDECYLFDHANLITDDVKDASGNLRHATSYNSVQIDVNDGIVDHSVVFNTGATKHDVISRAGITQNGQTDDFSLSVWLKGDLGADNGVSNQQMIASEGTANKSWGLYLDTAANEVSFIIQIQGGSHFNAVAPLPSNDGEWHMVNAILRRNTVSGNQEMQVFVDTIPGAITSLGNKNLVAPSEDIQIGNYFNGTDYLFPYVGKMDEFQLLNFALTQNDINGIYDLLSNKPDTPIACNYNEVSANTANLIGVPAKGNFTLLDLLGDDFNVSSYADSNASDGWAVYKRIYDPVDNSGTYEMLTLGTAIDFGVGYWLSTKTNMKWDTANLEQFQDSDYTLTTINGDPAIDIQLTSVSTPTTAGGPLRYNFTGYTGKSLALLADCDLVINGTAINFADLVTEDAAKNSIWLWDPGSASYVTCSAADAGCALLPFTGFLIELNSNSFGQDVKLRVPLR